jgi:hypothetical protein
MDNPEKLASYGTQYEEKHNTICAKKHIVGKVSNIEIDCLNT